MTPSLHSCCKTEPKLNPIAPVVRRDLDTTRPAVGYHFRMSSDRWPRLAVRTLLWMFLVLPLAQAEEETDVLRIREPVVIQHGQEVTSAVAIGSPVQVDGTVRENAVSIGGDVRIGPTGVVEGDAVAIGGKVVLAPGAHVNGKTTSTGSSLSHLRRALAATIPALAVGLGVLAGAALVIGSLGSVALAVVVLFLFPDHVRGARLHLESQPGKILAVGALALFLALPILTFLTLTVIGIPLAFVVAGLLMAALVLGTVAIGQWVGLRLAAAAGRSASPMAAGLIGLLVLTLLSAVPVAGTLVQVLLVCLALGAVFFSRFRTPAP